MLSSSFVQKLVTDPVMWVLATLATAVETSVVVLVVRQRQKHPPDLLVWLPLIQLLSWLGVFVFLDALLQRGKLLAGLGLAGVAGLAIVLEFALLRMIYADQISRLRVAAAVLAGNVAGFAVFVLTLALLVWLLR